ncbi:MAG: DUF1732 domain-containing protein [Treponema sp.]|jgi:uncharacterized protein YicC (UPF0701 family)|nr:DUF1732 domain-containing protein [Treponema sp.]
MKSMTGYGYHEQQYPDLSVSVEIKSYNNRFLELLVNLPPYASALESRIRSYVVTRCRRGKVEITLRLKEHTTSFSVSVNRAAAEAYKKALLVLGEIFQSQEQPGLGLILGLEGVLGIEKQRDDTGYWKQLEPVLCIAFAQFDAARDREGTRTKEDILSHVALLEDSLQTVSSYAPALELLIQENIRSRFIDLLRSSGLVVPDAGSTPAFGATLGDCTGLDHRILAETAVLLMKYTISEELARFGAHLTEFRAELERNPSPGKKLDFLCQEINREVNTIGSKTPILEVSRAVVVMKDALENIREQLRNVE